MCMFCSLPKMFVWWISITVLSQPFQSVTKFHVCIQRNKASKFDHFFSQRHTAISIKILLLLLSYNYNILFSFYIRFYSVLSTCSKNVYLLARYLACYHVCYHVCSRLYVKLKYLSIKINVFLFQFLS